MESQSWIDTAIGELERVGVTFASGLDDTEGVAIESQFAFVFPPDLRALLQAALPTSRDFVDWRGDAALIHKRMRWPYEGICFDIEHNNFWMLDWGERPANLPDAFKIAEKQVSAAPKLIPIYSHRYIPDDPQRSGNPVFSVWQTDIIYYGYDLPCYLQREFKFSISHSGPSQPRRIRLWPDIAENGV